MAALVDYVNEKSSTWRLPAIMALGFIASWTETMAKAVIDAKAIEPLVNSLKKPKEKSENEDHLRVTESCCVLTVVSQPVPGHWDKLGDTVHITPMKLRRQMCFR